MKSKRIIITAVLVVAIVLAIIFLVPQLLNKGSFGLKNSGSLYENISDFAVDFSGEPDELTHSFLKSIQYEITAIDKENMTATVEISVPILSDELSAIIDDIIKENGSANYDDLKQLVANELISRFSSSQFENKQSTLATVYKGNIIKNLIMDCQSYTKYRPNKTTGGIFVSWRRKEELPTGA